MSLGQLPLDCPCFLRSNIYIDQIRTDNGAITIRKHFTFDDEAVFRRKEWALLRTLPTATSDALIAAICEEIARREAMDRAGLRYESVASPMSAGYGKDKVALFWIRADESNGAAAAVTP